MDQKALRELEKKCIQEEPPECVAACPIHVDVRTFIDHIVRGDWDSAWQTLRKTMPLPGILGRICDAPCREKCLRGRAGEPIRVDLLERACVSRPAPDHKVRPFPSRGFRAAVVGSGLSGLTAAWDLIRKGYEVTVFDPGESLGGPLLALDQAVLPREIVHRETEVLTALGVKTVFRADVAAPGFIRDLQADFHAVFLDLEAAGAAARDIASRADGQIPIAPIAQTTSLEGVFAGGLPRAEKPASSVWQAAEGRWAATSMDRYLKKVSPTAGRDRDGPFQTRLFTSLTGIAPLESIAPADSRAGYNQDEARAEAKRCLQCQCLECVKVCPYLEHFGHYPKKYAREIYNNESIVMGPRQANKLINSCSLCGLCEEICPENFPVQNLCLEARTSMVRRGKMPPSAHEFALLDMEFSNSEHFSLIRHEPGRSDSAFAFFPGCQLSASSPEIVRTVYDYLRQNLTGGVGLFLRCCNAPAAWGGREELLQTELNRLREQWDLLGRPQLVAACSTCLATFKQHWPESDIVSLWEVMVQTGLPEDRPMLDDLSPLAVHDPCTTRHEPGLRESARSLAGLLGIEAQELDLGRERTECCGFGGLMQDANPDLAREVIRRRAAQSGLDYLTYCAMCRDNLAGAGKRAVHLLDLIWPGGKQDPAARKRPGWSERRENRARLKQTFLKETWGEKPVDEKEQEQMKLFIAPDVQDLLDRRRILTGDVQKVIARAEESGRRLFHPDTGHFKASLKPLNVTFWVEYSPLEDGFTIHNAYCHRMEVVGGKGS